MIIARRSSLRPTRRTHLSLAKGKMKFATRSTLAPEKEPFEHVTNALRPEPDATANAHGEWALVPQFPFTLV